jgi:spermidine/putrescine transport system ATP-binding protein
MLSSRTEQIHKLAPSCDPAVPDIEFRQVTKRYGEVVAVDRVDLEVRRGAFHSLLGPSGCGKTTSLRLIARVRAADRRGRSDRRVFDGGRAAIPPPREHGIPALRLFPHLDVTDNVGYGCGNALPAPIDPRLPGAWKRPWRSVRLPGFGLRRIWELSGGQQQRVALARRSHQSSHGLAAR